MGKKLLVTGSILLLISVFLFILDFISLKSILLYILSIIAFLSSLFGGKKIAYHVHDSHLARKRGMKIAPSMAIYLWLLMFIIFLIAYSVAKIALGLFIKLMLLPLGGKYLPIIYNIIAIFASYLLFYGLNVENEKFLTIWGKSAEMMENTPKNMMNEGMSAMKKGKDVGEDMMGRLKPPGI